MAFVTGDTEQKVTVRAGTEEIYVYFPPEGDPTFEKAKKRLSQETYRQRGRRQEVRLGEAREKFFDSTVVRVENWLHKQDGELVDPMTLPNWKRLFPFQIKNSIVGEHFEAAEVLPEQDQDDLPEASDED